MYSPKEIDKFLTTIFIAHSTSTAKPYSTIIEIKGKETKGWVVIDQIRTVDRRRITKNFGKISEKEILKIKEILKETFID